MDGREQQRIAQPQLHKGTAQLFIASGILGFAERVGRASVGYASFRCHRAQGQKRLCGKKNV